MGSQVIVSLGLQQPCGEKSQTVKLSEVWDCYVLIPIFIAAMESKR